MTAHDPLAFRFDCGGTWLNLLATKGRTFSAEPVERIATPARLAEWLERCELSPRRGPGTGDVAAAQELRETLRVLAMATVEGAPPGVAQTRQLVAFVNEHDRSCRVTAGDRLHRDPPDDTLEALARIGRQALDQLTGADRAALRMCPERDCRGVFMDAPGRRRWCPSPACASRGRVRALRARKAQA